MVTFSMTFTDPYQDPFRASDSPATYGALQMCFDLIWFDYPSFQGHSIFYV